MKKILIAGGLFLSIAVGSLSLTPQLHTAIASPKDDEANQADWAKSAKLRPHEAQMIAQAEVPGKVLEIQLEKEKGTVAYEVVIYDGTTVKEVTINAKTGQVLKVAIDDDAEQKLKEIKNK